MGPGLEYLSAGGRGWFVFRLWSFVLDPGSCGRLVRVVRRSIRGLSLLVSTRLYSAKKYLRRYIGFEARAQRDCADPERASHEREREAKRESQTKSPRLTFVRRKQREEKHGCGDLTTWNQGQEVAAGAARKVGERTRLQRAGGSVFPPICVQGKRKAQEKRGKLPVGRKRRRRERTKRSAPATDLTVTSVWREGRERTQGARPPERKDRGVGGA